MIIKTTLCNRVHPEYGDAHIPFPIPSNEYDHIIEMLNAMGFGDALAQDCRVVEISSTYPILNRLVTQNVNVDELDYLAKRLDSFSKDEADQFLAMASKLCLSDIKDFINLTFCCQQATVITSFFDLERVGKSHSLTVNGGAMPVEEYSKVDGQSVALDLIQSGKGVVTPYGVVYDNGMKLEQVYDGIHFPEYHYESVIATVTLTRWDQEGREMLYLPCPDIKITRALQRLGVDNASQYTAVMESDRFCDEVCRMFNEEFALNDRLDALNSLARCCQEFTDDQMEKYNTIFDCAWPQTPDEVVYLAEDLPHFTVVTGISSIEDYGKIVAAEMEIEPCLLEFLDYDRLGQRRINEEGGVFGERGYIAYKGAHPEIKEILARHILPTQDPQMGGLTQ